MQHSVDKSLNFEVALIELSFHTSVFTSSSQTLYSYTGQHMDELSYSVGVVLSLLRRVGNNWYQARLDGQIGLVSCSYVTVIQPLSGQSSIDEGEQSVGRRMKEGRGEVGRE